jgi:thymidylate synthase
LNKADRYFLDNLRDILNDGELDQNPRPHWKDGTPAHTKFITQVTETYDISKGEIPITTLRPIAWKNGIKEIFWIYQDQSSDLNLLRDKYGVSWWDEWDIGDRTIGQRYGATINRYGLIDKLLNGLDKDKYGRSHIMNMFQYADFNEKGGLNPCCYETLWSGREEYLDCTLIIRSSDYLMAGHVNRMQYCAEIRYF